MNKNFIALIRILAACLIIASLVLLIKTAEESADRADDLTVDVYDIGALTFYHARLDSPRGNDRMIVSLCEHTAEIFAERNGNVEILALEGSALNGCASTMTLTIDALTSLWSFDDFEVQVSYFEENKKDDAAKAVFINAFAILLLILSGPRKKRTEIPQQGLEDHGEAPESFDKFSEERMTVEMRRIHVYVFVGTTVLGVILIFTLSSLLHSVISHVTLREKEFAQLALSGSLALLLTQLLAGIPFYACFRRNMTPRTPTLTATGIFGIIAAATVWALAAQIAISHLIEPDRSPMAELFSVPTLIYILSWSACLSPLAEEIFFRGFLQGTLNVLIGKYASLFVTASLFVAVHGPQHDWYWLPLIPIAVTSFVASYLRMRFDSVIAAIAFHFGYNIALIAPYFIAV